MFLAINKKKLKELSNTKLTFSETAVISGGQTRDTGQNTLVPSKTTGFKCVVDQLPGKAKPNTLDTF
ncbi:hypothetical protein C1E24_20695 [Pseudoalteromonas phenolica]|uniref:Uncharacterized protein n=1 Tax=Pseudoalteromonas phenolica TaxID=161398 RepID=A0A5R9PW24_9GAMM|nr:hypothetical protein [Pseudoalteromonas phenolica]TLX45113.1 hypothetical protein C1E24_20695 [Pseudoalteromonas phenolica]